MLSFCQWFWGHLPLSWWQLILQAWWALPQRSACPAALPGRGSSFPWRRKPPNTTFLLAAPLLGQSQAPLCLEPQEQPLCSGDNGWFLPFGGENLCLAAKTEQLLGCWSWWDLPLVKFPSVVGWRRCWSSARPRLDLWMEESSRQQELDTLNLISGSAPIL